mmetsp:Transcript_19143/g.39621  ORF Transcript_19143/g.39621 Transcript_19143/m.39621 type:complete len:208 (-) Transcript_19143:274-897(-)
MIWTSPRRKSGLLPLLVLEEPSSCVSCWVPSVTSLELASSLPWFCAVLPSPLPALVSSKLPPALPSCVSSLVLLEEPLSCANTGPAVCSPRKLLELPMPCAVDGETWVEVSLNWSWDLPSSPSSRFSTMMTLKRPGVLCLLCLPWLPSATVSACTFTLMMPPRVTTATSRSTETCRKCLLPPLSALVPSTSTLGSSSSNMLAALVLN